tara:strand:+ start:158 stop:904 length:747 start_codon:yes stop_codon:yes gene_type:complete
MELENQLLESLSLKDLLDLSKITSSGLDLGTGKRDVSLTDPLEYKTSSLEDEPLPDDLIYVTRGKGLDKKRYVGNKDREMNFLKRAALGVLDAIVDNTKAGGRTFNFDWDRQNLIPEDEYNAQRLVERRRKADLSGKPTMTRDEALASLEGRRELDRYEMAKAQYQRDDQLKYLLAAYPQLADMISKQIYDNRLLAESTLPSEISKNLTASQARINSAKAANADAYLKIASAMSSGLGRYPGLRNVSA